VWITIAQNMVSSLHVLLAKNALRQRIKLIKKNEFFLQTILSIGTFCPLKNHAIMQRNEKNSSFFYTRQGKKLLNKIK
jgi:hypothetical protein